MNKTYEQMLEWLDDNGHVKEWKDLPFSFEVGRSKVETRIKRVPTFKDFNVCDDYNDYCARVRGCFYKEYDKRLKELGL